MSFEHNPFLSNSGSNDSSISRYLGGGLSQANSGIGIGDNVFSDILQTQMMSFQPISSKVDAILQRLENDQPLVGVTHQEAAEAIFDAIKQLLEGVSELLKSYGQSGSSAESSIEDLSRLIQGAKCLFDQTEDPYVLEQMGETWNLLRKKKSPVFHSVHTYFFSVAVTFSDDHQEPLLLDSVTESDDDVYSYSEHTSLILLDVVESLEDSPEKENLLHVLELVNIRDSEDDLDGTSVIDSDNVASSEQSTFFFE